MNDVMADFGARESMNGDNARQQQEEGEFGNDDGDFAAAMAKTQAQMPPAKFDSTNPHFRSRFASFKAVVDVAKFAADNGICYLQTIEQDDDHLRCVTTLLHTSGQQRMSFSPWFRPAKQDAHGVAGACTYARRIGLALALGISADEDRDGNDAVDDHDNQDNDPPTLDLARKASQAAALGLDSYQRFFMSLDKAERAALLPLHEALKDQAAAVKEPLE